jgi:hypothetical protein
MKWFILVSIAIQVLTAVNIEMNHRSVLLRSLTENKVSRKSVVGVKKKGHSIDGSRIQILRSFFVLLAENEKKQ